MIATDAPIPYDPEDGPYDPNDDAAVDAYWNQAIIRRADGTIVQQPRSTAAHPDKPTP